VCLAGPGSGLPRKFYAVTGILDDVRHVFVGISIDQEGYDLQHRVPPGRWALGFAGDPQELKTP